MDAVTTAPAQAGATKPERIDFLKQVVAFTEGNIRSYDTKAQISLAAFVLSANPLVAITSAGCSPAGGRLVLMVLVPTYIATILTYMWVLWPVKPPLDKLTAGLSLRTSSSCMIPSRSAAPYTWTVYLSSPSSLS